MRIMLFLSVMNLKFNENKINGKNNNCYHFNGNEMQDINNMEYMGKTNQ